MDLSLHFLSNTVLFVVCLSMGTMFLAFPVPQKSGLRNYKISLRVLASAYSILGLLSMIIIVFKIPDNAREHFTFLGIGISSFQVLLFSSALITLINPKFVTFRYLIAQITPFLFFITFFILSAKFYGNPVITHLNEISLYLKNPTLWIRLLFYGYYIFQLFFYTWLYFNEEKKYKSRALNYFSDEVWLKLTWVRFAFIAALAIGTIAMISCFFPQKYDWIFNLLYTLFYLGFALEYIKYNKIFRLVEPIIVTEKVVPADANKKPRSKMEWLGLKQQIINNNYYLETGVNIEDIAQRLRIGRTTLSTFINREEGVNFNTWINTMRIEKAKELLIKNPDEPLSLISEKIGYSEQSNFSRQFRQITGYAPTLWRQQQGCL
ncbi:MAG: AraC family transcriptional regulator [Salinivirgaceae bacterium]|nr:AraC family transcriptional regulator [Salinivirgaceae bacterium]